MLCKNSLQSTVYSLQSTVCNLPIVDCRLPTVDCRLPMAQSQLIEKLRLVCQFKLLYKFVYAGSLVLLRIEFYAFLEMK